MRSLFAIVIATLYNISSLLRFDNRYFMMLANYILSYGLLQFITTTTTTTTKSNIYNKSICHFKVKFFLSKFFKRQIFLI